MKTILQQLTTGVLKRTAGIFLIMMILNFNYSHGQCPGNLLTNTDFSNGLTNWNTFTGFVPPPINATNGCLTDYIVLRAGNTPPAYSDGIEQSVNISAGICYDLCMCLGLYFGSIAMNDVQIWAATNNPGVTFSSLMNNTYPAGSAELITVFQVNAPAAPQQYCKLGWIASQNYTRIIIFNSSMQPSSEVLVDNICFKQTNLCAPCVDANISAFYTQTVNGLTATFTNLTTSNIGNLQYSWAFNDPANAPNDVSTQQHPVYTFSGPGVYTVCLTATGYNDPDSAFLCQDTYCICVMVPGLFIVDCDTTGNNFTYVLTGNSATFTASSPGGFGFDWDFGDPNSGPANTSVLQNPVHVYSAPGSYNVCLMISYPGSTGQVCRDTICKTILVGTSSVDDFLLDEPFFYPNPVSDVIHFSALFPGILSIITANGQVILAEYLHEKHNTIDVSQLKKGIYFLRYEANRQTVLYRSFIKD